MNVKCRMCGDNALRELIDLGVQPVAHNLLDVEDAEDRITHPLLLHYCEKCGFVQINDPIPPEKLYEDYNYCFSQWKNQPHIQSEIELFQKFIPDKEHRIMEVGCNDGVFIKPLLQAGYKNITGVEPNRYAANFARKTGVNIINSMFTMDTVNEIGNKVGKTDLLILRQVLEHIPDLGGFFDAASYILNDGGGMLFIEVPDFEQVLRTAECSTIWEEHPNYFTKNTLAFLLQAHGFEPITWEFYDFSGGAMAVLAKKSSNTVVGRSLRYTGGGIPLREYAEFSDRVFSRRNQLVNVLASARKQGYEIYLYGSGVRACTMANGLSLGKLFDGCVDDQKEKQGHFMPGCRLPIKGLDSVLNANTKQIFLLAVNHENEQKVMNNILSRGLNKTLVVSLFSPQIVKEIEMQTN